MLHTVMECRGDAPPHVRVQASPWGLLFVLFLLAVSWANPAVAAGDPVAAVSTTIATYQIDSHPYSVVIDPAGELGYISVCGEVAPFNEPVDLHSGFHVLEFDAQSLEVLRSFDVGFYPTEMLHVGDDLWVSCSTVSALNRIDLASGMVWQVPFEDSSGGEVGFPSGLAEGWSGEIIVASNGGSFDGSNENIIVIDPDSEEVIQRYEIAGGISSVAALDDGTLLVPVGFPGDDFTAPPSIVWIDGAEGNVVAEISLDVDTSDFPAPSDLALLDDNTALITIFGGNSLVYRIDLQTRELHSSIEVPSGDPVQSAVVADGLDSFLVADYFSGLIHRIELEQGEVQDVLTGNQLPNRIVISGERIFTAQQGQESVTVHAGEGAFIRGDVNLDDRIDLADPVMLLQGLFVGPMLPCEDSADFDDNGILDISDGVQSLMFLFVQGSAPAFPFPIAGGDMTSDVLDCIALP